MTRHTVYQRLSLRLRNEEREAGLLPFWRAIEVTSDGRAGPGRPGSILPGYAWHHDDRKAFEAKFPHIMARYQTIANLGMRLVNWHEPSSSAPATPKPIETMPAGYTYFGQLMAHDLSFNTELIPHLGPESASGDGNLRRPLLALETLYGGGPKAFPIGYRTSSNRLKEGVASPRLRFRIGKIPSAPRLLPAHDLPRLAREELDHVDGACPASRHWATDVLIADGRNDDHTIISQLAALFMSCHNRAVDVLESTDPEKKSDRFNHVRLFERARQATVYLYRLIIWNDYLRRLLDPAVFDRYVPAGISDAELPPFIKAQQVIGIHGGFSVSVEFSHAVFRFGHSMLRRDYPFGPKEERFDIDEVLKRSSTSRPELMPVDERWIVDWPSFFGAQDAGQPVLSRPIGPRITAIGPAAVFVLNDEGEHEREIPIEVEKWGNKRPAYGLAIHDLIRSMDGPVASVTDLIAFMQTDERLKAMVEASPLLKDRALRSDVIQRWLEKDSPFPGIKDVAFSDDEIGFLATTPPLYLFVLIEAEHLHEGRRLGPLGSFIVAETIAACCGGLHMIKGLEGTQTMGENPSSTFSVISDLKKVWRTGIPRTMGELVTMLPTEAATENVAGTFSHP